MPVTNCITIQLSHRYMMLRLNAVPRSFDSCRAWIEVRGGGRGCTLAYGSRALLKDPRDGLRQRALTKTRQFWMTSINEHASKLRAKVPWAVPHPSLRATHRTRTGTRERERGRKGGRGKVTARLACS